ncbi:hypothetical protein D3C86_2210320 [compost metagenome]
MSKSAATLAADRFDSRPNDYRRAVAHATAEHTKVMDKLVEFGMAPNLADILEL